MFKLKRPCSNICPFRADTKMNLRPGRVIEIAASLLEGESFACHNTLEYLDDDDGGDDSLRVDRTKSQECAGAVRMLLSEGKPNTFMQLGERFRVLFPDQPTVHFCPENLDLSVPVFESALAFIVYHTGLSTDEAQRRLTDARQQWKNERDKAYGAKVFGSNTL